MVGLSASSVRQNFSVVIALAVIAGALILLPLTNALVFIGGVLALAALLRWHELALYALIFAIPYGSWFPIPISVANVTAADLLVAVVLVLWLARMIARDRAIRVHLPPLTFPFALFLGAAFLSFTVAESLQFALKEFVKWAEMFAVYVFIVNNLDEAKLPRLLAAMFVAGISEAAIGLYQFLFKVGPEGFTLFNRFIRAYGTFEQPNPYAGYLGLIVPVALGVALGAWLATESRKQKAKSEKREAESGKQKVEPAAERASRITHRALRFKGLLARLGLGTIAGISLAMMLAALSASWSRGAWLGVGAALVVTVIVQSRRALIFSLVVVLVLAAVIFLSSLNLIPSIVAERFSGIADYFGVFDVRGVKVDDANYAIVERMAHWQSAFEMFASNPWLGVGFGNYTVAYPRYALPHWSDPLGHAHNYFLNVAAETGLLGAFAYVLLWGAAFWQGWRAVRGSRGLSRTLAAGLLGMLVGLTIHNSFDNLFVHSMQMQVGIGLGIVGWLNSRVVG